MWGSFKRAERLSENKWPKDWDFISEVKCLISHSQNKISHDKNKPFIGILHNYIFSHAVIEI